MVARPAGFEPTVFRVGVENVIHCTTAAGNPYIITRGMAKGKKNIDEAREVPKLRQSSAARGVGKSGALWQSSTARGVGKPGALRQPSAARDVGKTCAARRATDCESGGVMTLRGEELHLSCRQGRGGRQIRRAGIQRRAEYDGIGNWARDPAMSGGGRIRQTGRRFGEERRTTDSVNRPGIRRRAGDDGFGNQARVPAKNGKNLHSLVDRAAKSGYSIW